MMEYPIKRNLDGVYYRVKREDKWTNACYSDLTPEERDEVTADYELPQMRRLANLMADALRRVGDTLDIAASLEEE